MISEKSFKTVVSGKGRGRTWRWQLLVDVLPRSVGRGRQRVLDAVTSVDELEGRVLRKPQALLQYGHSNLKRHFMLGEGRRGKTSMVESK